MLDVWTGAGTRLLRDPDRRLDAFAPPADAGPASRAAAVTGHLAARQQAVVDALEGGTRAGWNVT